MPEGKGKLRGTAWHEMVANVALAVNWQIQTEGGNSLLAIWMTTFDKAVKDCYEGGWVGLN